MISSDRSSILAVWIENRFKKQIFTFKILLKPRDFILKFTIFEIISMFSFWNKNFKRIKSQITLEWSCQNNIWLKQPFADVFQNKWSLKFCNIHKKTLVLESLFNKVALKFFIKKRQTTTQVLSCEYWEIFMKSFFYRTPGAIFDLTLLYTSND